MEEALSGDAVVVAGDMLASRYPARLPISLPCARQGRGTGGMGWQTLEVAALEPDRGS